MAKAPTKNELTAKKKAAKKAPAKKAPAKKAPAKKVGPVVEIRREALSFDPKKFRAALKRMADRARVERRKDSAQLRDSCKLRRAQVREQYSARKARILSAWREAIEAKTQALRLSCSAEREAIVHRFKDRTARAKALAAARRRELAAIRADRASRKASSAQLRALENARDSRAKKLDEARREVEASHPGLMPVFEKMKGKLKAGKGGHLAEAFFEWAEANAEQVQDLLAASAPSEREIAMSYAAHMKGADRRRERLSAAICKRATAASKKRKFFVLKDSEEKALLALGVNPRELMAECYPLPRSRLVSASQPFHVGRGYSTAAELREVPF